LSATQLTSECLEERVIRWLLLAVGQGLIQEVIVLALPRLFEVVIVFIEVITFALPLVDSPPGSVAASGSLSEPLLPKPNSSAASVSPTQASPTLALVQA